MIGKFVIAAVMLFSVFFWQNASCESWRELLDTADSLSEARDWDSAIVIGELALETAQEQFGADDSTVAQVLMRLGAYNYMASSYDEAAAVLERALEIREKLYGAKHMKVANAIKLMATVYVEQVRHADAHRLYQRVLSMEEELLGPDDTTLARTMYKAGCFYIRYGYANWPIADSLLKRSLAIAEKKLGTDHPVVARILARQAIIYTGRGNHTLAELTCKRAIAIQDAAPDPDSSDLAANLTVLACIRWTQGDCVEADSLFSRTLAIRESILGPDHPDIAMTLRNQAIIHRHRGMYAQAESLLRRSLALHYKAHGPDHPYEPAYLNYVADACNLQGKYEEAQSLYQRSLDICDRIHGPANEFSAESLRGLASIHLVQGDCAEAERLFKRALEINKAIVTRAPGDEYKVDEAAAICDLATVYEHRRAYAQAESLYRQSLDKLETIWGVNHPGIVASLNQLARIYVCEGKLAEAESLCTRSLIICEDTLGSDIPNVATSLELVSDIHRLRDDVRQAVDPAWRAWDIRRRNFSDNATLLSERDALTYSQFMRKSIDNYFTCCSELEDIDDTALEKTADVALISKGQVSDEIFRRQKSLIEETDSATLATANSLRAVKFRLSELFVQGPGKDIDDYRRTLDSLGKLANELETDLSSLSASFRNHQDRENISAARVASLLPENSVLVEYLRYNHYQPQPDSAIAKYLAIVLSDDKYPVIVNLGAAATIDSLVDEYRAHMLRVSFYGELLDDDQREYTQINAELYERVWKPLEELTTGQDLVMIAADGPLSLLSFAGLMDADGRYLIERSAIHYLSCGRDLVRLKEEASPAHGLLALGDPDYDASASARSLGTPESTDTTSETVGHVTRNLRSSCQQLKKTLLRSLPATRSEIEQVLATWKASTDESAKVYYGADASEENFKTEAPGSRVIHLATHGYFLGNECKPHFFTTGLGSDPGYVGENPLLLSGLFFAGANLHGEDADVEGTEDGVLTAYEVSALDLTGTDLVVLSACETGLGRVTEGEGVYGLRRAFQMAGARTVISALWPVSDRASAELIGRVYQQEDRTLPDHLRALQLDTIQALRDQKKPDHPISWGGFIALGDWR